jgi:hypothetical protein
VAANLRSVRIEALLPLHPAWQQMLLLRQEAEQFSSSQPRPDGIVLALHGLPSNFSVPQKVPASLVAERRRRLEDEAARYVASYSAQLTARNDARYRQEADAARATLEAVYQREFAALRKTLQDKADSRASILLAEKVRIQFRLVALGSQVAAYKDQAQLDAVLQRDRLRTGVAAIDRERLAVLAAVELNAIEQMAGKRAGLESDLARKLVLRRSELDQDVKDLTARELARLSELPDPIPAIGTTLPPARYLHETALPLPTPQETLQALQSAQDVVDTRVRGKEAAWQAQQARLIGLIRADTQQAVEEIAMERGWKLTPEGTHGAVDATQVAASAIKAQWKGQDGTAPGAAMRP